LLPHIDDIVRPAGARRVDQRGLEHCERRVRGRGVAHPRQRGDVRAPDLPALPRRTRDRHLPELTRNLHPMMRLTRPATRVLHEPPRRGTRPVERPLTRPIDLRESPRELGIEPRHLPRQRDHRLTVRRGLDGFAGELVDRGA
jgi:hypothetical protein